MAETTAFFAGDTRFLKPCSHSWNEPTATRQILWRFCTEYSDVRDGHADLMVIDADGVRFVEIRTDGDQLRRNQLLRQKLLREAGFRADVVRGRWMVDPKQSYVVVGVETTGVRGKRHHRALCDAPAAAELLLLIKENRALCCARSTGRLQQTARGTA